MGKKLTSQEQGTYRLDLKAANVPSFTMNFRTFDLSTVVFAEGNGKRLTRYQTSSLIKDRGETSLVAVVESGVKRDRPGLPLVTRMLSCGRTWQETS